MRVDLLSGGVECLRKMNRLWGMGFEGNVRTKTVQAVGSLLFGNHDLLHKEKTVAEWTSFALALSETTLFYNNEGGKGT